MIRQDPHLPPLHGGPLLSRERRERGSTLRKTIRWLGGATFVLAAWALVMVAIPFLGPPGRQVAVVGDAASALRTIAAAGGQVVEARSGAVLARSGRPGFARRLYRAGAPLVLEGRIAAGCFGK